MDLSKVDELVARAKLPEKDVSLCLDGDLNREWDQVEADLKELQNTQTTLADSRHAGIVARMEELRERMTEATLTLRLRALPRLEFRELVDSHPAREGNRADQVLGVDQSTFYDDLIGRCLVDPVLTVERLQDVLRLLTDKQYDDLASAAWNLNRADTGPKALTASLLAASSGKNSEPQRDSASATSGSSAGKRRKSSSTSTTSKGA